MYSLSAVRFPAKTKAFVCTVYTHMSACWHWANHDAVNQQKGRGLREGLFGWLSPSLIHEINHVDVRDRLLARFILKLPPLHNFCRRKNLIFTTNANGNLMLYGYGIHTFLYICQMSWYWMGKMTKRRGFSRRSGSSEGSKGVTDFSTRELADFPTPFSTWPFVSWPMDILRTLLALSVRIFLLGLCLQEKRRNATKTSIFFRCVVLFPSGNPHIHPSRYYVYV